MTYTVSSGTLNSTIPYRSTLFLTHRSLFMQTSFVDGHQKSSKLTTKLQDCMQHIKDGTGQIYSPIKGSEERSNSSCMRSTRAFLARGSWGSSSLVPWSSIFFSKFATDKATNQTCKLTPCIYCMYVSPPNVLHSFTWNTSSNTSSQSFVPSLQSFPKKRQQYNTNTLR